MSNDPSLTDESYYQSEAWFDLLTIRTKQAAEYTVDQSKDDWYASLHRIDWAGETALNLCLGHLMIGNFAKAQELLKQHIISDSDVAAEIQHRRLVVVGAD